MAKLDYIDNMFHLYSTNAIFEANLDGGMINPDSICFLQETNQIYTQGTYFGVSSKVFEGLKTIVENHTDAINNLIGISGPSVDNGTIDNMNEIRDFLYGMPDNSNLREILSALEQNIQDFKDTKGEADGIAPLDSNGQVPSSYLPSYVDDVLEFSSKSAFPSVGETGKIYVALDDNLTYRWSGSTYVEISKSISLGETSATAYPGNKGKETTDGFNAHKVNCNNPHNVTKIQVGLSNVDNTSDIDKPVSNPTKEYVSTAIAPKVLVININTDEGSKIIAESTIDPFINGILENPKDRSIKLVYDNIELNFDTQGITVSQSLSCSYYVDGDDETYLISAKFPDLGNVLSSDDTLYVKIIYNMGSIKSSRAYFENSLSWFKV